MYSFCCFMGWFNKLLKNIFGSDDIASAIGEHAGSLLNSFTGAHLTGAETEANDFTAAEAAKSRAWSESMRATNFQTQVQDMRSAGLNPALMYANGGSSSTPSGASATSVAPNAPSSLQEILALAKLKKEMKILDAQAKNIDSQTSLNEASADKASAEAGFISLQKQWYPNLTQAKINEINKHISLMGAQASEASAQAGFINASKLLKDKEVEWYDQLRSVEVALHSAETDAKKQEAAYSEMKAAVEKFRADYMNQYHTDVPAGAWVSLISLLATTFESTIFSDSFWQTLGKVFKVEVPDVHVEVTTGDTYNVPTSSVSRQPGLSISDTEIPH